MSDTYSPAEAEHELSLDPVQIFLPAGIRWSDAITKIVTEHDAAWLEAAEARNELEEALEDYRHAIAEDRAAFKKAAASNGKIPSDTATATALRALQFKHERYRHLRQTADRIGDVQKIVRLIQSGVVGYIEQALTQSEFYAERYTKEVFEASEKLNKANSNLRVSYGVLRYFAGMQDTLGYSTPENLESISLPNTGRHHAYLRGLREQISQHIPGIEKQLPRVYEDLSNV